MIALFSLVINSHLECARESLLHANGIVGQFSLRVEPAGATVQTGVLAIARNVLRAGRRRHSSRRWSCAIENRRVQRNECVSPADASVRRTFEELTERRPRGGGLAIEAHVLVVLGEGQH